MNAEAWTAIASMVGALVAAGSAVAVAAITKDVKAKSGQATAAAREAADLSRPTGNGYADDTRNALARIERDVTAGFTRTDQALGELTARQVRTNTTIVDHIQAHARHDVERPHAV